MNDKARKNKPGKLPEIELTLRSTRSRNEETITFTKNQVPIRIGRLRENEISLGDSQDFTHVSKRHCQINYDTEMGWVVKEEIRTTNGTWVHPKQYQKARYDLSHSSPVLLTDRMVVNAGSYQLEFEFIH